MTAKARKLFFMAQKFRRDLNSRPPLLYQGDNHSSKLGCYYFLFEENLKKLNRLIADFDENGVPLNTTYIDVKEKKLHYYPITIGQYALAVYHSYLKTKSAEKKKLFLNIADWFTHHKTEDEKLGAYWLTDVPKPEYKVFTPWKSAFSQSRALSVLSRAWLLTGKIEYFEICRKAIIPFSKDTKKGGVAIRRKSTPVFYEEYVADFPTRVIDGHIFSLFGLYDFMRIAKNINLLSYVFAESLFNEGVEGLIQSWRQLDLGYWFKYCLTDTPGYPKNDPCTVGYLRLIRNQLNVLIQLTGREELKEFLNKTKEYDKLNNIVKMYFLKFKTLKKLNRI